MAKQITVKPKLKNGIVEVKCGVKHEMSTYNQMKKKTGNRDDANFVTYLTATVNDIVVFEVSTSQFLSKNPILKFQFKGDEFKAGDKVLMSFVDRKGNVGKGKGKIKAKK